MDINQQQKKHKPWYKKLWIVIPLGIFVAPVIIITVIATVYGMITAVQESSKTTDEKPQQTQQTTIPKSAKGYVDDKQIIAQNHVQFVGAVVNTGESTARFNCHAEASDTNDELIGSKLVKTPELKPGESYSYTVDFETSKPATLIKYSRLTCE